MFIHNSYVLHINIMQWKPWISKKMQNTCDICSFVGVYFMHQHIYPCVKHVFNTWYWHVKCSYVNTLPICQRCFQCMILVCKMFIHQHIHLCVKHVFNTWYWCVKCTNDLWMNELRMIFIINLLHIKFFM